jgi:hypothetical protein
LFRTLSAYDQLEEVVKLASTPLPERPDGIVAVAKFTKASSPDCRTTEAEYERMARNNPSTIFLRCFAEYEDAEILMGQASVVVWPTFDIFYRGSWWSVNSNWQWGSVLWLIMATIVLSRVEGFWSVARTQAFKLAAVSRAIYNELQCWRFSIFIIRFSNTLGNRVARVEGPNHVEVEELLKRYQFQNSKLDLFSEISPEPWGDGKAKADFSKTPRTTARFLPGYDWGSDKGFFDGLADKTEKDFMNQFESSWIPDPDEDDRRKK